jgi:hypothetical protein
MVKGQAILLGLLDCVNKCTTGFPYVGKKTAGKIASITALSECQPQ